MCDAKSKCQKPENLKGAPQECTPDQIRACHGDAPQHPCTPSGCEKPENLKGTPQECTPEQIRSCHGEGAGHPCTPSE